MAAKKPAARPKGKFKASPIRYVPSGELKLQYEGRKGCVDEGAGTEVEAIYVNAHGELVADGTCGDKAFVCHLDELPELIDFLKKLVAAKK